MPFSFPFFSKRGSWLPPWTAEEQTQTAVIRSQFCKWKALSHLNRFSTKRSGWDREQIFVVVYFFYFIFFIIFFAGTRGGGRCAESHTSLQTNSCDNGSKAQILLPRKEWGVGVSSAGCELSSLRIDTILYSKKEQKWSESWHWGMSLGKTEHLMFPSNSPIQSVQLLACVALTISQCNIFANLKLFEVPLLSKGLSVNS